MKTHLRLAPVVLLAALLAGCQGPCQSLDPITVVAPALSPGAADFTRFAAVGTSISAGYQSGGMVDRHQVDAFPAIFARQIGKTVQLDGKGTFSEPTVGGNGAPALLQLRSLSPVTISNSGLTDGIPDNTTYPAPYGNMGVPGSILYDFANTTRYGSSAAFALVTRGLGSIQAQMLSLQPTFISFEYGANEVLGPATSGVSTQTAATNPLAYAAFLTGAMNAIHTAAPTAKLALFTVPGVTSIPFFTTFKPYTQMLSNGAVTPLIGPGGTPLTPTSLVLLTAQDLLVAGTGFPVGARNYLNPAAGGNGQPLPDGVVLDDAEQAALAADIAAMNTAVDSVAQRPWIAKVDMHGLLASLAANGIALGGTQYTAAFVSGGLFSLDGVHPTDLGHALLANTMIASVNARFGSTIVSANPLAYMSATASAAKPVGAGASALGGLHVDGLDGNLRTLFGR